MAVAALLALPAGVTIVLPGILVIILIVVLLLWLF
jgi:hypothetical protein